MSLIGKISVKRCPQCNRVETDNTLAFCRVDGSPLAEVSDEVETSLLPHAVTDPGSIRSTGPTTVLPTTGAQSATRQLEIESRRKHGASTRNSLIAGAIGILVVTALGVGSYWKYGRSDNQISSIAVMPFVNESGNADVEYLSDGMTETLISSLSQLPNLNVKPRSSVFRYKGKETNPQTIAKELNVQAILNGRVVQRGQDLSIFVELIEAALDKVVWSQQYNRRQSDLVTVQKEIAKDVSGKLKTKLSDTEEAKLTKTRTGNSEAYQLYMQGRYHLAKRTKDGMQRSIQYFQQAIKLDPNFAMAYVGIAESYNSMPGYPYMSIKEAIPQAKAAAQKALEIEPDSAEAHTALATSIALYDWNWAESEREFKRAFELSPNSAVIHYRYAVNYLVPMGRTNEAINEINYALELEPLALNMRSTLSLVYGYARQNEKALEEAKRVYETEPNYVGGRISLGTAYLLNGMYEEAVVFGEQSLRVDPEYDAYLDITAKGYARIGRRREAEELFKRYKEMGKAQYVSHYWIATIYAWLGERDEAITELGKAVEDRDYFIPRMKIEPFLDPLRDDPRFKEILKRMNLPE